MVDEVIREIVGEVDGDFAVFIHEEAYKDYVKKFRNKVIEAVKVDLGLVEAEPEPDYHDWVIRDMWAKMPYGLRCKITGEGGTVIDLEPVTPVSIEKFRDGKWNVKPYLRPMNAMTGSEMLELKDKQIYVLEGGDTLTEVTVEGWDWLNSHWFDYRDLIGKGLALVAPEGMYDVPGADK